MNVWKIENYPARLAQEMHDNGESLPEPLVWVEPSINNLYLEAVSSFLLGNYFSSIVTSSILLEHVLRLALVNPIDCGLKRKNTINEVDAYSSLTNIIDNAVSEDIFVGCNEQWWRDVAKYIRNKSAHYLLPKILIDCKKISSFRSYFSKYTIKNTSNNDIINDWGGFYDKEDKIFALHFLKDVESQLAIIISNTQWVGDESWWESQKKNYDSFFDFNWTYKSTVTAMASARRPLGSTKQRAED